MKPRIKPVPNAERFPWRCGTTGGGWCYGATPLEAYFRWIQYGKQ